MTSDGFKDRAPPSFCHCSSHYLSRLLLVFFFCFNTWSLFLFDLKVLSPSTCPFQVRQIKRSKLLMQFEPWRSRGCSQTNRCRVLFLFCAYFAFLLQAVFLRRSTDRFKNLISRLSRVFSQFRLKTIACALCAGSHVCPLKLQPSWWVHVMCVFLCTELRRSWRSRHVQFEPVKPVLEHMWGSSCCLKTDQWLNDLVNQSTSQVRLPAQLGYCKWNITRAAFRLCFCVGDDSFWQFKVTKGSLTDDVTFDW